MDQLKFKTESWDLNSKTNQYKKFVRNATKEELEKWHYLPRLTGYERMGNRTIRIEFSVPKLLFMNNVDEVQQNDFSLIIDALLIRLNAMGVIANRGILENAPVSAIHFSKNIQLENGFTANYIISELGKVNVSKVFDVAKTRFINNGESLYAHTTSYQFVVYDKIADLEKNDKRAIDKEQTEHQQNLFKNIKKKLIEILRFEIRLGNKKKMDKLFSDLGFGKNLLFKDIFNSELSKKVIVYHWEKLIKERSFGLFSLPSSVRDELRMIFSTNTKIKPKQAIYLIGLFTLFRDGGGIRELRSVISKRAHQRTWHRFIRDIRNNKEIIAKNGIRNWVHQIDIKLNEFEPYKMVDDGLST